MEAGRWQFDGRVWVICGIHARGFGDFVVDLGVVAPFRCLVQEPVRGAVFGLRVEGMGGRLA